MGFLDIPEGYEKHVRISTGPFRTCVNIDMVLGMQRNAVANSHFRCDCLVDNWSAICSERRTYFYNGLLHFPCVILDVKKIPRSPCCLGTDGLAGNLHQETRTYEGEHILNRNRNFLS